MNNKVVSNYRRMFVMPYVWKRCTTENRCNMACGTWPNSVTGTALNILHLNTRLSRAAGCVTRGERASDTHWTRGWEGPTVHLEASENRNISFPCLESNHIPWLSSQLHDH